MTYFGLYNHQCEKITWNWKLKKYFDAIANEVRYVGLLSTNLRNMNIHPWHAEHGINIPDYIRTWMTSYISQKLSGAMTYPYINRMLVFEIGQSLQRSICFCCGFHSWWTLTYSNKPWKQSDFLFPEVSAKYHVCFNAKVYSIGCLYIIWIYKPCVIMWINNSKEASDGIWLCMGHPG